MSATEYDRSGAGIVVAPRGSLGPLALAASPDLHSRSGIERVTVELVTLFCWHEGGSQR